MAATPQQGGAKQSPYVEFPWDLVIDFSFGSFGVLTVTRAPGSSVALITPSAGTPVADTFTAQTSVGPYDDGAKIPHSDWQFTDAQGKKQGYVVASVDFSSTVQGAVIYSKDDATTSSTVFGTIGVPSGPTLRTPGDLPGRGTLPAGDFSADAIYDRVVESYSAYAALFATQMAGLEASAGTTHNPDGSSSSLSISEATSTTAFLFDPPPVITPIEMHHQNFPPVGATIAQILDAMTPIDDGSVGSDIATQQFNPYEAYQPVEWVYVTVTTTSAPRHEEADAVTEAWLIDFAALAKEAKLVGGDAKATIKISQSFSPDPDMPGFANTYRLQRFGNSTFTAAAGHTVTDAAKASYDATRSLSWNDPGTNQLEFSIIGWVDPPPP